MSTVSIKLPESIHKNAKRLAAEEGCSLNQLISSAIAEKLAAIEAEDYLQKRAGRGRDVDIESILKNGLQCGA